MPFKSEKRRYLWAKHPKIARKFADHSVKKVTFDFHDTLTRDDVRKECATLIKAGYEVSVLSQSTIDRAGNDVAEIAKNLGITNVTFLAGMDKWSYCEANAIDIHYDNDEDQINLINSNCTRTYGILV